MTADEARTVRHAFLGWHPEKETADRIVLQAADEKDSNRHRRFSPFLHLTILRALDEAAGVNGASATASRAHHRSRSKAHAQHFP